MCPKCLQRLIRKMTESLGLPVASLLPPDDAPSGYTLEQLLGAARLIAAAPAMHGIALAAINRLRLYDAFVADALAAILDEARNGRSETLSLEAFAAKHNLDGA